MVLPQDPSTDVRCSRALQLIDLFPTFMDLAAVPQKERPESLDGRSLATLVASTAESYADDGVVAQVARCALARDTINSTVLSKGTKVLTPSDTS